MGGRHVCSPGDGPCGPVAGTGVRGLHRGYGEQVNRTSYSHTQRQRYRRKIRQCLDVFETMLTQSSFDCERPLTGMEIEGNLVGADYRPAMTNAGVLTAIDAIGSSSCRDTVYK